VIFLVNGNGNRNGNGNDFFYRNGKQEWKLIRNAIRIRMEIL